MDEQIILEFDISLVPKVVWLLNSGILYIQKENSKDDFDKESIKVAQQIMKDIWKEYRKYNPNKKENISL